MFIIIYAKIVDNKKKGLDFEGPFFGPECASMGEAHEECTKLVSNDNRNVVLVRIYDLDKFTDDTAMEHSKEKFLTKYENMQSAAQILERPIFKRKKRLKSVKI